MGCSLKYTFFQNKSHLRQPCTAKLNPDMPHAIAVAKASALSAHDAERPHPHIPCDTTMNAGMGMFAPSLCPHDCHTPSVRHLYCCCCLMRPLQWAKDRASHCSMRWRVPSTGYANLWRLTAPLAACSRSSNSCGCIFAQHNRSLCNS